MTKLVKIATWNVNSIAARKQRLINFLDRHRPDALCLQELKCIEEKFPYAELREVGYHAAVVGQKSYNGVAILAKEELGDIRVGMNEPSFDQDARVISATVAGVRVISVYVPNGKEVGADKYFYKLNWLKQLRTYLAKDYRSDQPLVVAGDFNIAPQDIDVHDPKLWDGKILCSEAERQALSELVEFGLVDTFRDLHPDDGAFSWWDYRGLSFPFNKGLRIDFILATPACAKACKSAYIDRDERKGGKADVPSDHAPVLAEFEI